MSKRTAVHIYLSTFQNESRIIKQTSAMLEGNIVDNILVIAIWKHGLLEEEEFGIKRKVIRVKSNIFPGIPPRGFGRIVKILRFVEIYFKVLKYSLKTKPLFVNIHQVMVLPLSLFIRIFSPSSYIIYDTHELETETNGLEGFNKKLFKLYERLFINLCKHVFVVSPSIENWYRSTYSISNVTTVMNCPNPVVIQKTDILRENLEIDKKVKIFLYQGALFKGRGIENLLEVFKNISEKKCCIVFMGYGECEAIIKEAASKFKNIYFHEAVNPNVVLEYTSSADYGVSLIEEVCLSYSYCLPNKIFEYLMAGLPCIVSNLKDMSEYMDKYKVGVVCESNTIKDIENSVNFLANIKEDFFKENIQKAQMVINWQTEKEKMLKVYRSITI